SVLPRAAPAAPSPYTTHFRSPDPGGVLAAVADDVVPGAHHGPPVDRHGPHRRVGEHEPERERGRQIELGDDRLEIVAVGTEPIVDRKSTRLNSSHVAISYAAC